MSGIQTFIVMMLFLGGLSLLITFLEPIGPGIGIPIIIILFLLGWFALFGIASKDKNQTVTEGAKDGMSFLKVWLLYISAAAIITFILFVLFG